MIHQTAFDEERFGDYWTAEKVVAVLRLQLTWLRNQQGGDVLGDGIQRVGWLVKGCVGLLAQSPQDYTAWTRRKNRAALIRSAQWKYSDRRHNKAVRDLVTLTINDLLANRPFAPKVAVQWHFRQYLTNDKATTCNACGRPFEAKRRTAKYCSNGCRAAASRCAKKVA